MPDPNPDQTSAGEASLLRAIDFRDEEIERLKKKDTLSQNDLRAAMRDIDWHGVELFVAYRVRATWRLWRRRVARLAGAWSSLQRRAAGFCGSSGVSPSSSTGNIVDRSLSELGEGRKRG